MTREERQSCDRALKAFKRSPEGREAMQAINSHVAGKNANTEAKRRRMAILALQVIAGALAAALLLSAFIGIALALAK